MFVVTGSGVEALVNSTTAVVMPSGVEAFFISIVMYYYVYILLCADNSFDTGITNNLERRLNEHNTGVNKHCYTFSRRPLKLVFHEIYLDPATAIAFEKKIKKWSAKKKQALISKDWNQLKKLSECRNGSHYKNYKP